MRPSRTIAPSPWLPQSMHSSAMPVAADSACESSIGTVASAVPCTSSSLAFCLGGSAARAAVMVSAESAGSNAPVQRSLSDRGGQRRMAGPVQVPSAMIKAATAPPQEDPTSTSHEGEELSTEARNMDAHAANESSIAPASQSDGHRPNSADVLSKLRNSEFLSRISQRDICIAGATPSCPCASSVRTLKPCGPLSKPWQKRSRGRAGAILT
mmetsp:Transcript_36229/g.77259  ORF Transcript_36229/g.77259 Transcript_36229/m.77259 type:complete len:212 (-) Transcript_36229:2-637(-)